MIGLAATLLSTKLLAGFLYGVSQIDPLTFLLGPTITHFCSTRCVLDLVLDPELEGKSYRSYECTASRMIGSQMAEQVISMLPRVYATAW